MTVGFKDDQTNNTYNGIEADTVRDVGLLSSSTRTTVSNSLFVNNSTSGQDNVAVGIYARYYEPSLSVTNTKFFGADSSHRLAADIIASSSSDTINVSGNISSNVVSQLFHSNIDGTVTATTSVSNFGSLNVGDRQPSTFSGSEVLGVRRTLRATSGSLANVASQLTAFAGSNSSATYYGIWSEAGDSNSLGINYTGSFNALYGTIRHRDTGTFTNSYTIRADSPSWASNGGLNTNQYGVYINQQLFASTTNAWALYQAYSGDKSYFAGNVGIGTTSPWRNLAIGTSNSGTFAISTSTAGCAQFSALGELYSTGSNCGTGSGSGVATSSLTATWPITLTTSASAITFGFSGLATATPWTIGDLAQVASDGTVKSIATSSLNLTTSAFRAATISQWTNDAGYLTGVTADTPLSGSGTSGSHLAISQASASTNGYLSSTDFASFNSRLSTTTVGLLGYLTAVTADAPLSGSGTSGSHLTLDTSGTWSGNAATASKLLTARNINGIAFDGSANITFNAASSTALSDIATWSGLQNFSSGLTAYASSTIGNGTQTGGLTVSGGATTTGSHYIGTNLFVGTSTYPSGGASASGMIVASVTSGNHAGFFNRTGATTGTVAVNFTSGNTNLDTQGNIIFYKNLANTGTFSVNFPDEIFRINTTGRSSIASTSPFAKFSIHANPTDTTKSNALFAVGSSTALATTTLFSIDNTGHFVFGGATPTVISGASAVSGSDAVGSTTPNTGVTQFVYIQFATPFKIPPHCFANLNTPTVTGTSTVLNVVATTTTQIAIAASAANIGGSTIDWWCPSN